ncbi:unnamed protein product [Heligmosomoides polygyrus]|uniref:COesterase domain-containing protein n=1 Tax=Heligmosomoides polygyrus TaxID=6339 RepID=A0A183F838_HELPZ|nr:unnamed protein product [Heligmosomoides polygyrus]
MGQPNVLGVRFATFPPFGGVTPTGLGTCAFRHFAVAVYEQFFPGFSSKDIWPSNSPDLNPVDYSVWSIMEQISNTRYATVQQLKAALMTFGRDYSGSVCNHR